MYQNLNVDIIKKDGEYTQWFLNPNEKVYEKIKQILKGDSDILVLCQDSVCYFDETFSQLKHRVSRQQDLIIVVKSLFEIVQCFQLCEQQKIALKILEEQQIQQKPQQQTQKNSSSDISTKFGSQILEQKLQNKTNEKLLEIVTDSKKIYLISQTNICESVIQFGSNDHSLVTSFVDVCYFCNNQVTEQSISLNCLHKYHEECLVSLFYSQLQKQSKVLNCLCSKQQLALTLNNINDEGSQMLLRQKLIQNQLNGIIQNYKLEKCQKPACYFYFLRDNKLQEKTTFCPLCLS